MVGGVLAAAAGAYLAIQLRDGWVPADEGSLAQSAERVVLGELPHRDFGELYTGGLTFLHATAFRIFGIDLLVPRLVLLVAFIVWVYMLYRVARFYLPRGIAVLTVGLGIVWSVPNYPSAIPSWYNLFFATAGILAVLQYLQAEQRQWLVVAGAAAGLSVDVKIVGLYLAAATAFYFLFHEQTAPRESGPSRRHIAHSAALVLVVAAGIMAPAALIAGTNSIANWFRFILPLAIIGLVILVQERNTVTTGSVTRFRSILSLAIPYGFGFCAPLCILLLYYAWNGATLELLEGVFVRPASRIQLAALPALPITSAIPTLVLFAWLALGAKLAPRFGKLLFVVQSVAFTALLLAASRTPIVFTFVWVSMFHIAPLIVVIGCVRLMRSDALTIERRRLFLLLSTTAFVSLIQFPYASAFHFYSVAPLVILSLAAVFAQIYEQESVVPAASIPAVFYLSFAVLLMNLPEKTGVDPDRRFVPLGLPRAGLRVPVTDSIHYGRLLEVLDSLGDRRLGYAGPDAPEVYFLAGEGYPSPNLFEFLDSEHGTASHVLTTVEVSDVVVLNYSTTFSNQFFASDSGRFEQRFPHSVESGGFTIRWQE